MSNLGRGLAFIAVANAPAWERQAHEERMAMYKRPDAEPLPAEEARAGWSIRLPRLLRRRMADTTS